MERHSRQPTREAEMTKRQRAEEFMIDEPVKTSFCFVQYLYSIPRQNVLQHMLSYVSYLLCTVSLQHPSAEYATAYAQLRQLLRTNGLARRNMTHIRDAISGYRLYKMGEGRVIQLPSIEL